MNTGTLEIVLHVAVALLISRYENFIRNVLYYQTNPPQSITASAG